MAIKIVGTDRNQRSRRRVTKTPTGEKVIETEIDPVAAAPAGEEEEMDIEEVKRGSAIVPREKVPKRIADFLVKIGQEEVLERMSEADLERLKESVELLELGPSASIIRVCSVNCESYNRCPLAVIKAAPLGKTCPIERDLYKKFMIEIKEAVSAKLQGLDGVEDVENDAIIMTLISQLVEIEILNMRANALIASAGIVDNVPALSTEMGVEYKLEEHVASKIKRDINNRKDKILRQLIASPEMAQKVGKYRKTEKDAERKRQALERAREIEAKIVSEGKYITKDDVRKLVE